MHLEHFCFRRGIAGLCSVFLLLLAGLPCPAQIPHQVKIIIENANIRSRPELSAEILEIAAKGALFEVIEKAGSWYKVQRGEDGTGKPLYGFIHESMVKSSGDGTPVSQDRIEPQPVPEAQAIPPVPPPSPQEPSPNPQDVQNERVKVRSFDRLISGSFIKCGFGDHWLASFGFDFGLGRHLALGLEFQPYFQNLSDIKLSVIKMDIFLNLKLGFKLGQLTIYGGGGMGPDLSFVSNEINGQTVSRFKTMLAYHGIVGLALNIGKIMISLEYLPTLISDPDIHPDSWAQFFFVGLRF